MSNPAMSATVPARIDAIERDQTIMQLFHRYNDDRRRAPIDAIATGIDTGQLDTLDPELTALAPAGPITYRRVMTGTPLPADHIDDLIDQVIDRTTEA